MKKITLAFIVIILWLPFIAKSQDGILTESSLIYSQLSEVQRNIYDQIESAIKNPSEMYLVNIGTLAIGENEDAQIYVDLPKFNLSKTIFQSNYISYKSEEEYAWNGSAMIEVSCLNDKCDTISGDSTALGIANANLTITAIDNEKSGHLILGNDNYNIANLTGGVYLMYKINIDPNWCATNEETKTNEDPATITGFGDCVVHKLKILVLYTPAALSKAQQLGTSPQAVAAQSMTQMQGAWFRSQICGAYNSEIVGVEPIGPHGINFTENSISNNINQEFSYYVNNNIAKLENVRADFSADLVILLTEGYYPSNGGEAIGIAKVNYPVAYYGRAYGMVHLKTSTTKFTFAHEVGHLLGALHDIPNDMIDPSGYAHGHHFSLSYCCSHFLFWCTSHCTNYYKDIMAYDDGNGDITISNYSNPNVYLIDTYYALGHLQIGQTGVANSEDNARKMNEVRPYVQDFKTENYAFSISLSCEANSCEPIATSTVTTNCPAGNLTYHWYTSNNGFTYTSVGGSSSIHSWHVGINHGLAYTRYVKVVVTDASGNSFTEFSSFVVPHCNGQYRMRAPETLNANVDHIFPNPGSSQFTLSIFSDQSENIRYEIYNSHGELILSNVGMLEVGENNINFDLSKFADGSYTCRIIGRQTAKNLSFSKAK